MMECSNSETLTQALYRLPVFTDTLMSMLSPSDCAALMVAASYTPSSIYRKKILSIHRELEMAGIDISTRLEGDGVVLIGSDVHKLILRIFSPTQFWKCRTKVENMYMCLAPKTFWEEHTLCCNGYGDLADISSSSVQDAGWMNVNLDSSSPLKILRSECELSVQETICWSSSEVKRRSCNLETIFGKFKVLSPLNPPHSYSYSISRRSSIAFLSRDMTVSEILKDGLTITETMLHSIIINAFCRRCDAGSGPMENQCSVRLKMSTRRLEPATLSQD